MELTMQKFKQTEVGLIPEDWDFVKIQILLDDKIIVSHLDGNHGALYPRSSEFTNNGVPYITANDFLKGHVNFNNVRYLPISRAEQFQKGIAKDGDVLFAHNATVGPTAVLETDLDYVILSTTATYFRTDNNKLNNYYLRYFFESQFFVRQYSAVMRQSTRNQIPITQQRKFSVILPPTLEEQKAIATALSDADELISNLNLLITKKKAIKQGAMQQLLTPPNKGGKRLDGFTGVWKEISIGNLTRNIIDYRGVTPKKLGMDWGNGDIVALSAGNVKKGYIDYGSECYYGSESLYKRWMRNGDVQKDDIVFTLEAPLGNVAIIPDNKKYILSQRTILLQLDKEKFSSQLLFQILISDTFQNYISSSATGSTAQGIKRISFEKLLIEIPKSIQEQEAIAQILSDIDYEIKQIESKKVKYQDIKQGMMQELLTGKTRLV